MQFLISENQIVGVFPEGENSNNLPTGFTIADFEIESSIESVYFADGRVQLIPDRPSENHVWIGNKWSEILLAPPNLIDFDPDWVGLISDLRGSQIWVKSFEAASTSIAANSAWTLLYGTLTTTNNLDDLAFSISSLRSAMKLTDGGDFTKAQLKSLNKMMTDRGFPEID